MPVYLVTYDISGDDVSSAEVKAFLLELVGMQSPQASKLTTTDPICHAQKSVWLIEHADDIEAVSERLFVKFPKWINFMVEEIGKGEMRLHRSTKAKKWLEYRLLLQSSHA